MKSALTFCLLFSLLLSCFNSCKKDNGTSRELKYDLSKGAEGWSSFFSDYPVNNETFYELQFGHTDLPAPINNGKSLKISGNNHSDDLLSVIYKKIDNLQPNTTYQVTFSIDLASNVIKNSPGIGGSPDLMLGAGGISSAPSNTPDQSDHYRPNFASALQSGLPNSVFDTLGRIGVSETNNIYTLINRNNLTHKIPLSTNAIGEFWLLIGTDSGFEGITTLYYSKITVSLKRY